MTKLATLNVNCIRVDGTAAFQNPRFLRVIASGPNAGEFCVMRHDKGIPVKGIAKPDTVIVDLSAPRIDESLLRPSTLADIGLVAKVKAKAEPAKPSDLTALIAKYTATVKRQGEVWLRNAMPHTKDPVKLEAMKIALGEKPEAKAKKAKSTAPKAEKPAVVSELVAALTEMGVDAAQIEAALKAA
jgi:hypothetical protein